MTSTEAPVRELLVDAFAKYPQPCLLTSIRGDIARANTSASSLFAGDLIRPGADPCELEGVNLAVLIGADRADLMRDLRIAASSPSTPLRYSIGETPYSISVATLRPENQRVPVNLLLTFSEGSVLRDQFTDLRAKIRKANQRAFEERRKRAEMAAKYEQLQQFSYAMAHDLKAPLREISWYMKVIREDHGDSINDDALNLIERATVSADQLCTLITDIMRYGATAGANLRLCDVELGAVVDDVLQLRSASLREASALVDIDAPLGAVMADPTLLKRILVNLIENAVKYRSSERLLELCISTTRDDRGWVRSLTVADNGQGFDPARAARLFEPFKRGHPGSIPGSGIGLATCKAACDLHGWSITATGEPDRFAAFTITFTRP